MVNSSSPAEQAAMDAAGRGSWADFTTSPVIRGSFLRELMLAQKKEGPGVRIRGATITGELDLSDCTGLPPLLLEDCGFDANLILDNAELARLSLKNSRINGVRFRDARLGGMFDFSGVRGFGKRGTAWIDGHGSKIAAGVNGSSAQLRSGGAQTGLFAGQLPYALRLSAAAIGGSLWLCENFKVAGGIHIGASILGDLWCEDAELYAAQGRNALLVSGADIRGMMTLGRLRVRGCVALLGTKIGGSLYLNGGHFTCRTSDGQGNALLAQNAEVGGDLIINNGFTARGCVNLNGAKISKSLMCEGAQFANQIDDGSSYALLLDNAEIGDNLVVRSRAKGCVSLSGAIIGGDLACDGAHFSNRNADGKSDALLGQNAEIGGAALLRNDMKVQGAVNLLSAKIGGILDCSNAHFMNHGTDAPAFALITSRAKIGGDVLFFNLTSVGIISVSGTQIGGDLNCDNAKLIAWPRLTGTTDPSESALDATNASISGDVRLNDTAVLGRLIFEHARISGGLRWNGLRFPATMTTPCTELANGRTAKKTLKWSYRGAAAPSDDTSGHAACERTSPIARLVLAHAEIGAALQAYKLDAEVELLIDLSAAQIYTLDDDHADSGTNADGAPFPEGWGGDGIDAPQIDLDGLVYQRIERFPFVTSSSGPFAWLRRFLSAILLRLRGAIGRSPPDTAEDEADNAKPKKSRGEQDIATPRKEWLARQYKPRTDSFYPQPYRHLAMVLRSQGHADAARQVAIEEARQTSRGVFGFLRRWSWGLCFSYGLSPLRAFMTLFIALCIGWMLVHWAYTTDAMEFTPDEIAAVATLLPLQQRLAGKDVICHPHAKIEIVPLLYATDLALPVVPLGQEQRCEAAEDHKGWIWAFAIFAILGKLITALTLITFSGVMKPKDD